MLNAASKIEEYIAGLSYEDFVADDKTVDAVIRQLTIIGEASNHIPEEVTSQYSNIPWHAVRGMRNVVVHEYFSVNTRILWQTATVNVPRLLAQLKKMKDRPLKEG
jgi:uncharacterized protein with HEPN domain